MTGWQDSFQPDTSTGPAPVSLAEPATDDTEGHSWQSSFVPDQSSHSTIGASAPPVNPEDLQERRHQAIKDTEHGISEANQAKPWYQNLGEAVPRTLENAGLDLLNLTGGDVALEHMVDPDMDYRTAKTVAGNAKHQNKVAGEGTGIAGTIGEMTDPRMVATMLAPYLWATPQTRAAMGAAMGATSAPDIPPDQQWTPGEDLAQRGTKAAENAALFALLPPAMDKFGKVAGKVASAITPDFISEPLSNAASTAGNWLGDIGGKAADYLSDKTGITAGELPLPSADYLSKLAKNQGIEVAPGESAEMIHEKLQAGNEQLTELQDLAKGLGLDIKKSDAPSVIQQKINDSIGSNIDDVTGGKFAGNIPTGLSTSLRISQEYGKRMDNATQLYGEARNEGSTKYLNPGNLLNDLDNLIDNPDAVNQYSPSQQAAVNKLKTIRANLQQKMDESPLAPTTEEGDVHHQTIPADHLIDMQQALNEGWGSGIKSGDSIIGKFSQSLKAMKQQAKEMYPDFGNKWDSADDFYREQVGRVFRNNKSLSPFWNMNDYRWAKQKGLVGATEAGPAEVMGNEAAEAEGQTPIGIGGPQKPQITGPKMLPQEGRAVAPSTNNAVGETVPPTAPESGTAGEGAPPWQNGSGQEATIPGNRPGKTLDPYELLQNQGLSAPADMMARAQNMLSKIKGVNHVQALQEAMPAEHSDELLKNKLIQTLAGTERGGNFGMKNLSDLLNSRTEQNPFYETIQSVLKGDPDGLEKLQMISRLAEELQKRGYKGAVIPQEGQDENMMNIINGMMNPKAGIVKKVISAFKGDNSDPLTSLAKDLNTNPNPGTGAMRTAGNVISAAAGSRPGATESGGNNPLPAPAPQQVAPAQQPPAVVTPQNPAPQLQSQAQPQQNDVIGQVARAYGNDPDLMRRIAVNMESGGDPNKVNPDPNSTAKGLYQFTDKTWRDMVQKYGQANGLTVRNRMDPVANSIAANLYMNENRPKLKNTLGRDPNGTELYLAHFLGAGGASKLLQNMQNTRVAAARLMPEAAGSNNHMFFENGRALTPAELFAKVNMRLTGA